MKPERLHIEVPGSLKRGMVEAARDFRKNPTPSEALLWQALRGKKLHSIKFRRQQPLGPFVVDFYAPSIRLVIEVDGEVHQQQRNQDQYRQVILESLDLNVLRFSADQVEHDLGSVLSDICVKAEEIRFALEEDTPSPSPSPRSSGTRPRQAGNGKGECSPLPKWERGWG